VIRATGPLESLFLYSGADISFILFAYGKVYSPGGILNLPRASITPSSSGSFLKSFLWWGRTICTIELTIKTNTAERIIGSQSETIETINTS